MMGRILFAAAAIGALMYAALKTPSVAQQQTPSTISTMRFVTRANMNANGVYIWTDAQTDCQYVIAVNGIHGVAITPRVVRNRSGAYVHAGCRNVP